MNHFQIDLDINQFIIKRTSYEKISTCNRSRIYVSFCFDSPWSSVEKVAVFNKKNHRIIEVPIINNCCLIPAELMTQVGVIKVSVDGGRIRTLNHVEIEVIKCSCQIHKNSTVIKSPDSSIRYIRQKNSHFEYYAQGRWHKIENNPDIIPGDLISADENNDLILGSDCKLFVSNETRSGIEEAPIDGKLYGRKNGGWEEIETSSSGVRSDWEQEDENELDHVKNRPQINNIVLTGNRVLPEVALTNLEIEELFNNQI